MTSKTSSGTRTLRISDKALKEAEYESIRSARHGGPGDPDCTMTYSEQTLEKVAHLLADHRIDVDFLFYVLKQPSAAFDVEPQEVYGNQVGEPHFPEEYVWLTLDELQEMKGFCEAAIGVIKDKYASEDAVPYEKSIWFLSTLRDFCNNALELETRAVISRN
jgi:hypothetical protein